MITDGVATTKQSSFRTGCRALLTRHLTVQQEPGLEGLASAHFVDSDDPRAARHIVLGQNDPLAERREPSELEALWYGRLLLSMLVRPGAFSREVIEKFARQELARRFPGTTTSRLGEMVAAALEAFSKRAYPGRNFLPNATSLDGVIDNVGSYLRGAIVNHASEWLQAEALHRGVVFKAEDADPGDYEDALIEQLDRARHVEVCLSEPDTGTSEAIAAMPAPSTARRMKKRGLCETSVPSVGEILAHRRPVRPPSTMSATELAKLLGRARTTVLSAIRRATERGLRIERIDGEYAIREEQVEVIRDLLRQARRPYTRKRKAPKDKYPKGAIIFGGDSWVVNKN